jgi:hypothetical protein
VLWGRGEEVKGNEAGGDDINLWEDRSEEWKVREERVSKKDMSIDMKDIAIKERKIKSRERRKVDKRKSWLEGRKKGKSTLYEAKKEKKKEERVGVGTNRRDESRKEREIGKVRED